MYKLKHLGYVSLLSFLSVTVAQADCVRHIYNNSNSVWQIKMTRYYPEYEEPNPNISCFGTCTLLPKQVLTIYYPNKALIDGGADVRITDKNNQARNFNISLPLIHCAKINHTGSTGSVSLNEPAGGDIKIEKDVW